MVSFLPFIFLPLLLPESRVVVDMVWGIGLQAEAEVRPFRANPKDTVVRKGELFVKGERVWRWRQHDSAPKTYLHSLSLQVGNRVYMLPDILLKGVVEPAFAVEHCRLWLSRDKKMMTLKIPCADAGTAFEVYYELNLEKRSVQRLVYVETMLISSAVAPVKRVTKL